MIRALFVAFALVPALASSASRFERAVTPPASGPARLEVDVELLSGASAGLKDLRLFDSAGREIEYLLVEPPAAAARWSTGRVLPVRATKERSGFEADFGQPGRIDRVRIEGIQPPFMKRATVEGSGDRSRWTLLATATVFDLPDERLRLVDIDFTAGAYRYIRVTWDDRASAPIPLPPSVRARLAEAHGTTQQLLAPLTFARRGSEPGASRYAIVRPGWKTPFEAIELDVANANVLREARLTESRLRSGRASPVVLGSATLRKVDGETSSSLAIPLSPPEGRELELVVIDGSSAPLEIRSISARFPAQPWIYFESDGAPLVARYGDDQAVAPRYDLEAQRGRIRRDTTPLARWSPAVARSVGDSPASAAALPAYGASLDVSRFSVRRVIDQAAPGLVTVSLDADVLARSRSLFDVRVVDGADRQVPYLLEERDAPLVLQLPMSRIESGRKGVSLYQLVLPYDTLPGARLALTTSARVFERTVSVRRPADESTGSRAIVLTSASWRAADPYGTAPAFIADLSLYGMKSIEVAIDEGDNAPLEIARAELMLPSHAVRFQHPGGDLFLLYGNPEAAAPRYDVALLAPRLLREPAVAIRASAAAIAATPDGRMPQSTAFWVLIVAAALILLGVLIRALRGLGPPAPPAG